jgi:hypothetical protein
MVTAGGVSRADVVEVSHDRLRHTVAAHMDAASRRERHRALAGALDAGADDEAIAFHWSAAGEPARAAAFARSAAEQAMRALAFDRAANLFRAAMDYGTGDEDDLLPRLGEALAAAGRSAEAAAAFRRAAEVDDERALDHYRNAGEHLLRSGHVDEALDVYRTVLSRIGVRFPESPRAALLGLLARRAQVWARGGGHAKGDEREGSPRAMDLRRAADTCWTVAAGLGLVDTVTGAYYQTRGYLYALDSGDPLRIARGLALEGCFSAVGGTRTAAATARCVARARELAREEPYAAAWVATAATTAATLEGRWAEAAAPAAVADRLFEVAHPGAVWERTAVNWMACYSAAYLGDVLRLEAQAKRRVREARQRGDIYSEVAYSTAVANLAWLLRDGPEAARERCETAMARWSRRAFHLAHVWELLAAGQILLFERRPREVLRALAEARTGLEKSLLLRCQLTRIELWHLEGRATLQAAEDAAPDSAALVRRTVKNARAMVREGTAWGGALAETLLAAVAARDGARPRAAELLRGAAAKLDAAQMRLYAAAARVRLAAIDPGADAARAADAAVAELRALGVEDVERTLALLMP